MKNLISRSQPLVRIVVCAVSFTLAGCAHQSGQEAASPPLSSVAEAGQCGVSAAQLGRVREVSAAVVARGYAPGITSLIMCDGKPIFEHTVGLADSSRPMAQDDLFRIYSMTKPLTSLAAMILVDDKRLILDEPVATYLPEFANATVFESGDTPENIKTKPQLRAISVRDLLRHSAGITYSSQAPGAVFALYGLRGIDNGSGAVVKPGDKSKPVANIGEFTQRLAGIPLLYQAGECFSYGNATDVLAAVVEKASGQRFRDFMDARIFKPLKMQDTFFQVPPEKVGRLTAAYAGKSSEDTQGRVLRTTRVQALTGGRIMQIEDPRSSIFSKPRAIDFGGAGLVSTAADYQRFLQALLQDGALDGVRVVSKGSAAEMLRNQLSPAALGTPSIAAQGLGFGLGFSQFLQPEKLPTATPKNGSFWGGAASTYFWIDPERRISGVVMTQVFGGDVMPFYLEMMNTIYSTNPNIHQEKLTVQ